MLLNSSKMQGKGLRQILEEPITRRNILESVGSLFLLKTAGKLVLLEEALTRLTGCASLGRQYVTQPGAPQIISDWMDYYDGAGRRRGTPHRALDIGGRGSSYFGQDILAAADGVIYNVGWNNDGGNYVMVYHGNDVDGKPLATVYMHMEKIVVEKGQNIKRGEKIGTIGETGALTTPGYPHVHYIVQHIELGSNKFLRENRPDPHNYWFGMDEYKSKLQKEPDIGPFVIPCFDPKVSYSEKPIRFTLPVKCK